jgi:uncharacterized protein with HEPN domain
MNREKQFLLDMLLSAKIAIDYLEEKSINELENNLLLQDAVIRRLLIIGEASRRISQNTQQSLPTIPWRLIPNPIDKSYFKARKNSSKSPKIGEARTANLRRRNECRGFRGQ